MTLPADPLFLPQALEALMLLCFGLAWPINSLHMLRSKRPEGKGLSFTMIVWCGYLSGAAAKVLWTLGTGATLPPVFWLYVVNSITVAFNAALYCRYRRQNTATQADRAAPLAMHKVLTAQ